MTDTLSSLLALKKELQQAFDRDMEAVDRLISRHPQNRTESNVENLVLISHLQHHHGNGQRGRPGTIVGHIRQAIRAAGKNFDLDTIVTLIDQQNEGNKIPRKAISSGLARLASPEKGQLRIVQEGVNGESLTVYTTTEKFPPARR